MKQNSIVVKSICVVAWCNALHIASYFTLSAYSHHLMMPFFSSTKIILVNCLKGCVAGITEIGASGLLKHSGRSVSGKIYAPYRFALLYWMGVSDVNFLS